MTEPNNTSLDSHLAATPIIKRKKSISIVWLIPIVALIIGGWLAYVAITEKGPIITISFETAEGLEAGKTKVKFKDVEVGVVEDIQIGKKLSRVLLKVEMHKGAEPYLTEKTKFWVVKARIGADQISGLGTLLGGAYIGIEPSNEGQLIKTFTGLEDPPIVTRSMDGSRYSLTASTLGSLNPGSPIYFRQIKVGQVIDFKLDKLGRNVGVNIFIDSPYDQFIRENTRFWIASGLDLQLTANGLRINTESLVSLMIGGIALSSFEDEEPSTIAKANSHFKLYDTREDAEDDRYVATHEYYIEIKESVRGLTVGAPVEFRGLRIGSVEAIELEADYENLEFSNFVRISIESQRLSLPAKREEDEVNRLQRMLSKGLRAQMKVGNLLTGQLFVDMEFFPDASPVSMKVYKDLYVLPSTPLTTQKILHNAAAFLKKLNTIPIEEMGKNMQSSLAGLDTLVNSEEIQELPSNLQSIVEDIKGMTHTLDTTTLPGVNNSLEEIQRLVKELGSFVSTDSPLYFELHETLQQLANAAQAINKLADLLERHPEALLQGKNNKERQ